MKNAKDFQFTYTIISKDCTKLKMHSDVVRRVGDEIYLDGVQHVIEKVTTHQGRK